MQKEGKIPRFPVDFTNKISRLITDCREICSSELREVIFSTDQKFQLLVADECRFCGLRRAKHCLGLCVVAEHVFLLPTKLWRWVGVGEQRKRRYIERFKCTVRSHARSNHLDESGLSGLEKCGEKVFTPYTTVSVKLETDVETSEVKRQSFQSWEVKKAQE